MIAARNLRKRFGLSPVLDGVSLDVARGECVALLGPNGAGKSTFLRVAATVLRPTSGALDVLGHDVIRFPDRVRGRIGLVAHGAHVWEDLTALENLRVWRTLADATTRTQDLMDALADVDLAYVAHDRVRTFSAGMKRRLSLARFVDAAVPLLLLDEPFTGLDHDGKKWLTEFVGRFKSRGGTVIMATHDLGRSLEIADRFTILAAGMIALDQPTAGVDRRELEALYASAVAES